MAAMAMLMSYRRISSNKTISVLPIQGIIFDMDGTLTIPVLNFSDLRARLGISSGTDILEYANSKPKEQRTEIFQLIDAFEKEGTEKLKLQPDIHDLFLFLKERNVHTALLTRNNQVAVDVFLKRFIGKDNSSKFKKDSDIFSEIVTRDFLPTKPDPAAVHHICSKWSIPEENVLVIGDDIKDIQCGNRAGSVSVLMCNESTPDIWKTEADISISKLLDLETLLQSQFDVQRT